MIALLIRHASTDSTGTLVGRLPGIHLNHRGRVEAARLAAMLQPCGVKAVYSSPRERALETGQELGAILKLTPVIDEAFDELDYGNWSGCRINQLDYENDSKWRNFNLQRSIARPPSGEWMIEAQIRAVLRMQSLARIHSSDTVAIISHADIIRAIVAYYSAIGLDEILRITISPATLTILLVNDASAELLTVNAAALPRKPA